jgi:hypothetical protein
VLEFATRISSGTPSPAFTIWSRCELFVEEAPRLLKFGIPIVIDHMGSFDVGRGVTDPVFKSSWKPNRK